MNGALSGMLGRPDLSPSYGAVVVSSDGTAMPAMIGGPNVISANVNASGTGQLGLGFIAAGVVGLVLFYVITRGIQK